jgi:hypothetical protein
VAIKVHALDNKRVTVVRFYLDTVEFAQDSVQSGGDYEASWDASADTLGGALTFKARAYDSAQNLGEDSVTIHIRKTGGGPKYHGGTLAADETWYATGNPHICTTSVFIDGGHKLTLMPGCTLRFRPGTGVTVGQGSGGELAAVGTGDSLIVFTSDSSAPNPGDWTGIAFHDQCAAGTRLSYCQLEYGGLSNTGALMANQNARFGVDHSIIKYSAGCGLSCEGDGHPADFSYNAITGCTNYPVRILADYIRSLGAGNVLSGNAQGVDGVYVLGSQVTTTGTWRNHSVPYLLFGDVRIGDASQPVVTVEAGTTIKLALLAQITVGENLLPGALKADASGAQPITFTSMSGAPRPGDWQYLYFWPDAIDTQCALKNCRILFGGRNNDGEVYLYNAKPEISGCAVDSSAGYGIYLEGSPGELPDPAALKANNTFSGNALGDVFGP